MSEALAKRGGASIASINITSLPDLWRLAEAFSQAEGFVPKKLLGKPAAIAAVILTGAELGIQPMASLRSIHIVEGKPVLDYSLQLNLLIASGRYNVEWLESTDKVARLRLERIADGKVHDETFTIEMAKTAGLLIKDTWKKYPTNMLRARCVANAARGFAPDILSGIFVPDELDEIESREVHAEVVEEPRRPAPQRRVDAERLGTGHSQEEVDALSDAVRSDAAEAEAWVLRQLPKLDQIEVTSYAHPVDAYEEMLVWLADHAADYRAFGPHATVKKRVWTRLKNIAAAAWELPSLATLVLEYAVEGEHCVPLSELRTVEDVAGWVEHVAPGLSALPEADLAIVDAAIRRACDRTGTEYRDVEPLLTAAVGEAAE